MVRTAVWVRRSLVARRVRAGVAAAICTLVLVGCTQEPETDQTSEAPPVDNLATEPDVASLLEPDRGSPPSSLQVLDLVGGDGDEARPGMLVLVHYVGARWQDGAEFDSTWEVDAPFVFELGAGRVIEGWERGIAGGQDISPMRVGGRRMLIVPPELAYGDRGAGDAIGPGETLVFVIDLLDVEPENGDLP